MRHVLVQLEHNGLVSREQGRDTFVGPRRNPAARSVLTPDRRRRHPRELREVCEQLEQRGRDGRLQGAAELGQALADAHQRARTAVQALWIQGGRRCES